MRAPLIGAPHTTAVRAAVPVPPAPAISWAEFSSSSSASSAKYGFLAPRFVKCRTKARRTQLPVEGHNQGDYQSIRKPQLDSTRVGGEPEKMPVTKEFQVVQVFASSLSVEFVYSKHI